MNKNSTKKTGRIRRHHRVRAKISGTTSRPRVAVFKSNQYVYVQVIDDETGKTILGFSDMEIKNGKKLEKAMQVGDNLAKKMKEKGITEAVFDRGGFKFHGRIKAVADGLKKGGIKI